MSSKGYSTKGPNGRRLYARKPFGVLTDAEHKSLVEMFRHDATAIPDRKDTIPDLLETVLLHPYDTRMKCRAWVRIFKTLSGVFLHDPLLRAKYLSVKTRFLETLRLLSDGRQHSRLLHRLDRLACELAVSLPGCPETAVDYNERFWAEYPSEATLRRRAAQLAKGV